MACPLEGHEGEWLTWEADDYRKGTALHGSPGLVFRVRPTYILGDPLANFIVGHDLIRSAVGREWGKAETYRLGHENSEDALTFNVFRSLQEAGELARVAELVTQTPVAQEPKLILWGREIERDGTSCEWNELQDIREHVEPTHRQQTEPDVCIHVPGWGWIFFEAKFDHGIKVAETPDKQAAWVRLYPRHAPALFDLKRIESVPHRQFPEQLLRNMVFVELIRSEGEHAHVVALGRERDKTPIQAWIDACLSKNCSVTTSCMSWEQIYGALGTSGTLAPLRRYYEGKSHSLRPAFALDSDD